MYDELKKKMVEAESSQNLQIGQMRYIQKSKDLKKEDVCVVLASFHIKPVHHKALMPIIELKKLENLFGNLVVLKVGFVEDP